MLTIMQQQPKQNPYERLTKKVLKQAQAEQYARILESYFSLLIKINRKQKEYNETQNN
jgi:hypothetical protein